MRRVQKIKKDFKNQIKKCISTIARCILNSNICYNTYAIYGEIYEELDIN